MIQLGKCIRENIINMTFSIILKKETIFDEKEAVKLELKFELRHEKNIS